MEPRKDRFTLYGYLGVGAALFLLTAFKPVESVLDAETYLNYAEGGSDELLVEPSFLFISSLAENLFGSTYFLFLLYALIGIPLKLWTISRLSPVWFFSVLFWMSHFFILQDLTQIRASAAVAFFLFGLYFLSQGRRVAFLLCAAAASVFHISALVLFPLFALGNAPLSNRWKVFLAVAPVIGYALAAAKFNFLTTIPIPYIQEKLEIYEAARDAGAMNSDEINVFNAVVLVKLLAYYLLLWKYEVVRERGVEIALWLKIQALSIVCFTAFSFLPVLSFRISELYGVVEILLFPALIYIVRPQWASRLLAICFASGVFFLDVFYNDLIQL
ncbi:MAG: EpsG family protein [Alloprevotella sp.]